MNPKTYDIIAIDVSKKTLQAQFPERQRRLSNDSRGFESIARCASRLADPLVVCEATGGYERALVEGMRRRGIPTATVNPALVHAFRASHGVKAKSDPIDAAMIARFARERRLQPGHQANATQRLVAELLDRRSQLSEHLASEKARLDKASELAVASIDRMTALIQEEIGSIERSIRQAIAGDSAARKLIAALQAIKGVGRLTAWSVFAYLPQIGSVSRAQIAAIAGLAPYDRDSGQFQGKRRIHGGRAKVRRPLYMAAVSAKTHNAHIKAFYDRLLDNGKPFKVAIVAAMRKLIIHIQAVVKKTQLELA